MVFDRIMRPDTIGVYCEKALKNLGHEVTYFGIKELPELKMKDFDFVLQVDDDFAYFIPPGLNPSAYWIIDGHRIDSYGAVHNLYKTMLMPFWRVVKSGQFTHTFVSQKDKTEGLKLLGVNAFHLLPAVDPTVWKKHDLEKKYDWCFVGNLYKEKKPILAALQKKFPNCYIGKAYFEEAAKVYSQSKVVLNISFNNDLNMRIFEAMACGSLLLTNDQPGLGDVSESVATYTDEKNVEHYMGYWLENAEEREKMAKQNQKDVLEKHTYENRMKTILETVFNGKN